MTYLFTSESVTEGHPDKIADQISDAVLDSILAEDPNGRVACETLVTTGLVLVAGEISTKCYVDIPGIARKVIEKIGYNDVKYGFDHKGCSVLTAIDEQSPDIAVGVNTGGAGDQGMMFGYACDETPELMPLPILSAHLLARALARARKSAEIPYLRPDGKTQVTIEYNDDGTPARAHTVVVSTQHNPDVTHSDISKDIIEKIIKPTLNSIIPGKNLVDEKTIFHINPTGIFIIGGPPGDCGLTGRKIIVDTYGGMGRHGGGCFSGKDPSKVDRSGAYIARYIAKNIVANGLAKKCEVQISYAIGVVNPVSVYVNDFGTGKLSQNEYSNLIMQNFDLTPKGIIQTLDLLRPIYLNTASYGHFGRSEFPWEKVITLR